MVFLGGLSFGIILILYSMVDCLLMYKRLMPALLIPFVIPAQVFGYGFGFINNFIRRVILDLDQK